MNSTHHQNLIDSLNRYAEDRIETGSFLRAVLENDLASSIGRADHESLGLLPDLVSYVYNNLPSDCWGSAAKVEIWLTKN